MYKVVGIDPGEANSGLASLVLYDGKMVPLSSMSILNSSRLKYPHKATDMPSWHKARWLEHFAVSFIIQEHPDLVVLEYPALSGYRLFDIGALHYAILRHLTLQSIDWIHMGSGAWKVGLFGKGCGKIKAKEYVHRLEEGYHLGIKDDNVAAAVCLAYEGGRFMLHHKGILSTEVLTGVERSEWLSKKGLANRRGFLWECYDGQQ